MIQSYYAPRFNVVVQGITMAANITQQVISVTYSGSLDHADMFKIVFSNTNGQYTDLSLFTPGVEVELYMGYGDNLTPMMLGVITTIEPNFPESGPPTITISGYDKSYNMRHGESIPRQFEFMTDSLMVAEIAAENLLIPICDPSPWFHESLTQTGTDWAFIKDLANNNLFDVYVYWNNLYFQLPIQTDAYVLEWGQSLRSFSPRLSTATMAGVEVIRGYNEQLATAMLGVATGAMANIPDIINRLGPATLDMLASLGRRWIHSQKISSPVNALALGTALLQQLLDGLYEGTGSCIGIPTLRAGSYIQVAGVGTRFGGVYRLRKVTHTIDDNGYITEFDITQQGESSILALIRKKTDVDLTPPRDHTEKFYGVYVAKVLIPPSIIPDPDPASAMGARVKVSFPWLSDTNMSGWARVCVPQASANGSGVYFMPNPGDTVIVAFQDGEISMPVVIGSVWDGPYKPTVYPPVATNLVSEIKTRAGQTITLDDALGISISNLLGSSIKLDMLGNVSITAANAINLNAKNVAVTVTGAMTVT
ncbi:MAG TPA: phage baseplate assembly protein V [Verrucomicrobiae bacterium]|nr:phage baseplate assembly protein V [Verrucomicrobiae bacterium]HTZ56041.1 phage baseplate assembly protein V [Candidatus Acidoferrum sp.]